MTPESIQTQSFIDFCRQEWRLNDLKRYLIAGVVNVMVWNAFASWEYSWIVYLASGLAAGEQVL